MPMGGSAGEGGGPMRTAWLDDALRWAFPQIVTLVLWAALSLVTIWIGRVVWRERMLRRTLPLVPADSRAQLRREVRRTPLMRTGPPPPRDPFALVTPVVVPPLGDGRAGESFMAPGPATLSATLTENRSRQDAVLSLGAGMHMIVVCLGPLGGVLGEGEPVEPAADRARACHARGMAGATTLGPVDRLTGPIGEGWRVTYAWPTGRVLTDTHVDHDGWAFVVGVLSTSWHARAVEALDAVLATWVWLSGRSTPAPGAPPPDGSPGDRT